MSDKKNDKKQDLNSELVYWESLGKPSAPAQQQLTIDMPPVPELKKSKYSEEAMLPSRRKKK